MPAQRKTSLAFAVIKEWLNGIPNLMASKRQKSWA